MTTSMVDAESLLSIDVGGINTRVALFDVVDGRYRYLGSGSAATTVYAPYFDIGEGIRAALDRLQMATGRVLVGNDERLIIPARDDGSGVDTLVATMSAGPPLNVVVLGLLEQVSLESARRLATTTYARVIETISLNDRRKPEQRIDTLLRLRPDLVLAAGGTDRGASQSVMKLLESIGLASYLMPEEQRPEVLFAGNQALLDDIDASLGKVVRVHYAPNLRPALDAEQLGAAQVRLSDIYRSVRSHKVSGVEELDAWAGGGLLPTAAAFGRVIRFLGEVYDSTKAVMGIDVGASATTIASVFNSELTLSVFPQYGLGQSVARLLEHTSLEAISRWMYQDVSADYLRDYLYQKSAYPASIPVTPEELDIEQALARQVMQMAIRRAASGYPAKSKRYGSSLLPWFEPIVASGSVLTRAPNLGQSMLMLLDGIQPTGVTTVVLDQSHITPALGAAAAINPVLAVQVLETGTLQNLGTVVSLIGKARFGSPVLRARMVYEDGNETPMEVKQGSIVVLPLPAGQSARLHLTPLQRFDVGMGGAGRGGGLRVVGGALGVVVDARGRPLRVPDDPARRRELIHRWRQTLGG
jgi:uncharacterized protein (TIGR01319 family)